MRVFLAWFVTGSYVLAACEASPEHSSECDDGDPRPTFVVCNDVCIRIADEVGDLPSSCTTRCHNLCVEVMELIDGCAGRERLRCIETSPVATNYEAATLGAEIPNGTAYVCLQREDRLWVKGCPGLSKRFGALDVPEE